MFGQHYIRDPIEVAAEQHTKAISASEQWEMDREAYREKLDKAQMPGVCPECNAQGCPACYGTGLVPRTLKHAEADSLDDLASTIERELDIHTSEWDHGSDIDRVLASIRCRCSWLRRMGKRLRHG